MLKMVEFYGMQATPFKKALELEVKKKKGRLSQNGTAGVKQNCVENICAEERHRIYSMGYEIYPRIATCSDASGPNIGPLW